MINIKRFNESISKIKKIDCTKQQFSDRDFKRFEYSIIKSQWMDCHEKLCFLAGLVPSVIRGVFGGSNFKVFNNFVWIVEFRGSEFAVISASGRGTSFESTEMDDNILLEFIDEMVNIFK